MNIYWNYQYMQKKILFCLVKYSLFNQNFHFILWWEKNISSGACACHNTKCWRFRVIFLCITEIPPTIAHHWFNNNIGKLLKLIIGVWVLNSYNFIMYFNLYIMQIISELSLALWRPHACRVYRYKVLCYVPLTVA